MQDWSNARETWALGLQLRFNLFSCLPHRLLGLCAVDVVDAQVAAVERLQLWDASGQRAAQHPVARHFLAHGQPLRALVEHMADGEALSSLPLLAAQVLPWRFLSFLERSIEAKHSIAKKKLAHNSRPSPPIVSLALRMNPSINTLDYCSVGGVRSGARGARHQLREGPTLFTV